LCRLTTMILVLKEVEYCQVLQILVKHRDRSRVRFGPEAHWLNTSDFPDPGFH